MYIMHSRTFQYNYTLCDTRLCIRKINARRWNAVNGNSVTAKLVHLVILAPKKFQLPSGPNHNFLRPDIQFTYPEIAHT